MRYWIASLVLLVVASLQAQEPLVIGTTPAQNALDVSRNTVIEVTFDMEMDSSTISPAALVVYSSMTGRVSGNFEYNPSTMTATFAPDVDFPNGDFVTVIVTSSIQSSSGVALADGHSWQFTVEAAQADAIFWEHESYSLGTSAYSIVTADFNGDQLPDLALAGQETDSVQILLNQGNAQFAEGSIAAVGNEPNSLVTADFNSDGFANLAVTSRQAYTEVSNIGLASGEIAGGDSHPRGMICDI